MNILPTSPFSTWKTFEIDNENMRDRFELYFLEEEFQDLSLSLSLARPTVTGDALRRLPTFHARVIPAMGGK